MINLFYTESSKILVLVLLAFVITIVILVLSYTLSISKPDTEKLSAYECGFDPYEDARNTFDVRFYLVSILFIIFDLETVYFFPWCASFIFLNVEGFWGMMDFGAELLAGYIYAWEAGALEWD
jgi:NADH-quinone oxidoreductase subunit A